ncbi:hypothetical protein ACFL0Z_02015 [Patescibacteria group bacterium]
MPKKRFSRHLVWLIYVIIPIVFIGWLGLQNLPINGVISQVRTFPASGDTGLISDFYPANRTAEVQYENGYKMRPIINDNAYFDVRLPATSFQDLALEIWWQRPANISEVRLGIPRGPEFQFQELLMSHRYLDALDWPIITEGQLTLWQKEPAQSSIDEFLGNPPQDKLTAVHPTAPTPQLFLDDYQPNSETKQLPSDLQGPHSFFTYIKDENLQFTFTKADLSEPLPGTPQVARIADFRGRELKKIDITSPGDYEFNVADLSEGLYRIDVLVGENSVLKDIETNLSSLVSRGQIWLAAGSEPTSITLLGDNLTALVAKEEGKQKLTIEDTEYHLTDISQREHITEAFPEILIDETEILTERGDVKLASDGGYFAFTDTKQIFNPVPSYTFQLTPETSPEEFGEADYVLAAWLPPAREGDLLINEYQEPVRTLYSEDRKITYALIIPELSETCDEILVNKIKASFSRNPLSWAEMKRLVGQIL